MADVGHAGWKLADDACWRLDDRQRDMLLAAVRLALAKRAPPDLVAALAAEIGEDLASAVAPIVLHDLRRFLATARLHLVPEYDAAGKDPTGRLMAWLTSDLSEDDPSLEIEAPLDLLLEEFAEEIEALHGEGRHVEQARITLGRLDACRERLRAALAIEDDR